MDSLLLETCWRLRGRSGRVFTCGIYCADTGVVEVCVSHAGGEGAVTMVFSETVTDLAAAREVAEHWRKMLLARATFHELLH